MGIWILLVSLMILELCIAFFRQLAPQMTSHCFARFLFGFFTFFYLFVLFILFLVLTVIVVVTVLFGDICKSPDETIVGLIGGTVGGSDDDANTNAVVFTPPAATGGVSEASNAVNDKLAATSSGGADDLDGAQLMSYFITCDTDETQNNTFNVIATEAFDYFGVGVTEFNNLYQPFENKTEGFETRKNTSTTVDPSSKYSTAPGVSKAFEEDAAAMKAQMASLRVPFYALVESITGRKDGVTDVDIPKQGMQDGLFKIVNCYQVNSRYQAVIGMMCGQFFETIAMTVEYLLVAGVFMVIVEFCKRLCGRTTKRTRPATKSLRLPATPGGTWQRAEKHRTWNHRTCKTNCCPRPKSICSTSKKSELSKTDTAEGGWGGGSKKKVEQIKLPDDERQSLLHAASLYTIYIYSSKFLSKTILWERVIENKIIKKLRE